MCSVIYMCPQPPSTFDTCDSNPAADHSFIGNTDPARVASADGMNANNLPSFNGLY